MKKIYAFVFMYMLAAAAFGQQPTYLWAGGFGGPAGTQPAGDEYTCKFVADPDGNMYVIGHFTGTVDFDPGAGVSNLVSAGDSDIFVGKYGRNGDLVWQFRIGGAGPDDGLGIVLHGDLLYITGAFSGDSVDFDPIIGGTYLSSNGAKDIFLAKFDTTGFLFWAHGIGGTGIDYANSIAVDDSGNVILTGAFSSNVDFDPGTGVTNLNTGGTPTDAFIAKYTEFGTIRWAYDFGGGTTGDIGWDVTTDDSGFVYTVGQFLGGNIDFDTDPTNTYYLTSLGNFDAYVASYNYNGQFRWAFRYGASNADKCNAIALDTANNVVITGRFQSTVDFDPGPGTAILNSASGSDGVLAKYDNNGNYIWAYQFGSASNDEGVDIAVNPYNNYYVVTGSFNGTVDFNPGGGVATITAAGGDDAFVAAYEPNGAYAWAFNVGGSGKDVGTCVLPYVNELIDSIYIFVGGNFANTADFDPGAGNPVNLTSNGGQDLFLAGYYDGYPVGINTLSSTAVDFHLYPNPSRSILHVDFAEVLRESDLRVTDLNGRLMQRQLVSGKTVQLDVSAMDAGIYIVSLEGNKGISHARFTVVK